MRQLKLHRSITNRESASLEKYLQDISREPTITPEQEVELSMRISQGDEEAINLLAKANLRFVVSVAKQYQGLGLSLPDLIDEGNMGLFQAARKFDATLGLKFISYAVWWIRQSIIRALVEQSRLVRLPQSQVAAINRLSRISARYEQELGRRPTLEELADETNQDVAKVAMTLRNGGSRQVSMDAPIDDSSDGSNLLELISDQNSEATDEGLMDESLTDEIDRAFAELEPREQQVLRMFFGIATQERTLEEIASTLGMSRERIRQIKDNALRKLRRGKHTKALSAYLG